MFKTSSAYGNETLNSKITNAERSYLIHPNDYISFSVYTNNGERLIDPNLDLRKSSGINQNNSESNTKYIVKSDSTSTLPMIGNVKIGGLTLSRLDSLLTTKFSTFYNDVFVISKVVNKRVFVLGTASAGMVGTGNAKVIPLENENMNLIEVITLAGGLDNLSKANNIRLIRGDLKNPTVFIVDLSTIEGVKNSNLLVQPNDIIYIERYQRRFAQSIQETSGFISLLSGLFLLTVSIFAMRK